MAYDASSPLAAVSAGIQGIAALGSAYEQSTALAMQGEFQANMARINQQFAAIQSKQVLQNGSIQADAARKRGNQEVGAQRASAAAQGLDVNDSNSSFSGIENDTLDSTAHAISTIRSNAWKEAWGITTNASNNVAAADFNEEGEKFAGAQTLLVGGLKATGAFVDSAGMFLKSSSAPSTKSTQQDVSTYNLNASQGLKSGSTDYQAATAPKGAWWMPSSEEN